MKLEIRHFEIQQFVCRMKFTLLFLFVTISFGLIHVSHHWVCIKRQNLLHEDAFSCTMNISHYGDVYLPVGIEANGDLERCSRRSSSEPFCYVFFFWLLLNWFSCYEFLGNTSLSSKRLSCHCWHFVNYDSLYTNNIIFLAITNMKLLLVFTLIA